MLTIFILSLLFGKKPSEVKKLLFGKKTFFVRSRMIMTISFLLLMSVGYSQSNYNTNNWRFSNPQKFGFTVTDIDFFDDNKGVAVGANGGIAYTTNGGSTWSYGAFRFMNAAGLETSSAFIDVHFISSNTVYAVGSNGCMVKSVDGGVNWSFVNNPLFNNGKSINSVWFQNDN